MLQEKVKTSLEKVCMKLPESISDQCIQFVDLYGDAIVAILAQEIDPSQVSLQVYYKLFIKYIENFKVLFTGLFIVAFMPRWKINENVAKYSKEVYAWRSTEQT